MEVNDPSASQAPSGGGSNGTARPIEEFYSSGRLVVPLTAPVKRFVEAYTKLFASQKEAADAAGVDLSTINNYATAYKNMALTVFDRMAAVMRERMEPSRISKLLGGKGLADLRAHARKQNGAWVDHVMYAINDNLLRILQHYTTPFRSREEAGLALGLNARTYTAYLKGQIQCFPRKYFWLVVDKLKERGLVEQDILKIAGVRQWDDFLVEKQRACTVEMSREEVLERMLDAIMEGRLKKKELDSAFLNAISRTFGNFGEAVLGVSQLLSDRATEEIKEALDRDDLGLTVQLLNRYGEYYKRCRRSLEFIRRARKEDERGEIDTMLAKFQKALSRMEKFTNLKAQVFSLTLVGGINGGFVAPNDRPGDNRIYQLAKEYAPDRRFEPGDLIYHGGLGLGQVMDIRTPSTIIVRFSGSKQQVLELAQNRTGYYAR